MHTKHPLVRLAGMYYCFPMPEFVHTHVTVRVDRERIRRVHRLAARRGVTLSELVRALLDQVLLADEEQRAARGARAKAAG